ncbi:MAG: hypothetical protein M3R48_04495, partial [Candidatus Dormibacteraeota bacterium]|nr:hypothetical protein [Candidatus Dormibacteraeota bacterium]
MPRGALEAEYGAAVVLEPARVAVSFVSTLDGVVSFGLGRLDSRAVGGGIAADRLVMALLRSLAAVIVVGAGTLRASPDHQWTAETLLPARAADIAALRYAVGHTDRPAQLLVVSATGRVPSG